MAYRYWCGECGFKTAWSTESQGERQQIEHYRKQHPGLVPGGQVEVNHRSPSGAPGCLQLLGLLVLLLVLAAACHR
ncbi:hypothetical protein CFP65_4717 [Kitasatospora sp. MMS16-BH015]|uniref:hypothetical protein n=1 Tax=Kitasatospora sp. MMS16-BH015 TaxID=2018025 RepID=UPI000CA28AA5|nr:hypothetical protein [Kitasatospora sp. MMS16-BH015]AUG79443.1 hypothetical protein CFP65_4717 [Kitasatospora sp. MMS16-BH015]